MSGCNVQAVSPPEARKPAILIMAHYAKAATLSSTLSITLSFIPNGLSEGQSDGQSGGQSGPLRIMRIAADRNKPLDRLGSRCYFGTVNGKLNLLLSSALLLCSAAVGL
jgi:hypothetical protein